MEVVYPSKSNVVVPVSKNAPPRKHPFRLRKVKQDLFSNDFGPGVRFMTYNVRSQQFCNETKPTASGQALSWSLRFQGICREIEAYKPDILLLQEVDVDSLNDWIPAFRKFGLEGRYIRSSNRSFGIMTAWRRSRWNVGSTRNIWYDELRVAHVPRQCDTESVGLVLVLEPIGSETKKMVVANTHFYWHPDANYERCRQLILLFRAINEMRRRSGATRMLFGGDLNAVSTSPLCRLLRHSGCDDCTTDVVRELEESMECKILGRVPSLLPSTKDTSSCISWILSSLAKQKLHAVSLYSLYRMVDDQNVTVTGEPKFTNWTDDFKDTIDYLFDLHTQEVPETEKMYPEAMLRMPRASEMGPQPNSQPRLGYYPSDHLAMMVQIFWWPLQ